MVNNKQNSKILNGDCANCSADVILERFATSLKGLTTEKAEKRLEEYGYNEPARKKKCSLVF
jgi:magnesium-transporting ATPase (P-type)